MGVGATTTIFSLVNAVLLRPLPVRRPHELVRVVQRTRELGTRSGFPYAFYEGLVSRATTLAAVFGELDLKVIMSEPSPAEQVHVHLTTDQFFTALGVPALYGRTLDNVDAKQISGTPPAVVSYGFWRKRFGADPRAVGRTIVLKGHPFVIVGVMPRQFSGITIDTSPDLRVPFSELPLLAQDAQEISYPYLEVAARLRPGVHARKPEPNAL